MKYWYLKDGDILGPWSVEEIAKDSSFAKDSLVCPEDKAEQAEFWKPASAYSQDFDAVKLQDSEAELEIPPETSLDDISLYNEEPAKETLEQEDPSEEKSDTDTQEQTQEQTVAEEKNPFETDRPQIAPNIEETISSHTIAPRLDADGDTLLEDIPAKAILGPQEDTEEITETLNKEEKEGKTKTENDIFNDKDFVASSSLASEDTLEDTPILNIFERAQEPQKTKELKDISDDIYDTYGADDKKENSLKIKALPQEEPQKQEQIKKNKKLYLLLIVMFVLVVIALLLAAFGSNNESSAEANKQINYVPPAVQKAQKAAKTDSSVARNAAPQEEAPAIAAEDLLSTIQKDDLQRERALVKVKDYILPSGKTIETFLDQKYSGYQTSWNADVLSANNYFVHFKASKIRQEPLVYSFSIDLDKNEINGLNNLGMDLLLKGE